MTDDIVERLRSFAELGDIGSVAMEDAADEIVNLRAALNWLRGWRTKDHESIDCTIQHALGGAETCDVCHPHGSEALPASAQHTDDEAHDRSADANWIAGATFGYIRGQMNEHQQYKDAVEARWKRIAESRAAFPPPAAPTKESAP